MRQTDEKENHSRRKWANEKIYKLMDNLDFQKSFNGNILKILNQFISKLFFCPLNKYLPLSTNVKWSLLFKWFSAAIIRIRKAFNTVWVMINILFICKFHAYLKNQLNIDHKSSNFGWNCLNRHLYFMYERLWLKNYKLNISTLLNLLMFMRYNMWVSDKR